MKWKQKVRYQLDQFLSKGTLSLVLMLFLITFFSVLILGFLAFLTQENGGSVFHSMWVSFMLSLDAGNLAGVDGSGLFLLLMTVETVIGIFITSMLISIITTGFQSRLENLRKGTSQIVEKNHTLVLGWNDNVPVIVKELIAANLNARHPVIVILSEEDMQVVCEKLKSILKSFRNSRIIIRTGSIFDKNNLEMVAIDQAKSVIISNTEDVCTIKTLLAIKQTCYFQPGHAGFVTAILTHRKNLIVARNICGEKLEAIYLSNAMNRIMAQTCLQPGLSFVYKDLFDFEGDEIYFFQSPKLTGKTVQETINLFNKSAVIGLYKDGEIRINPDKQSIISETDKIIAISEDDDTILLDGTPNGKYASKIVVNGHFASKSKRNILSIGYNENTLKVIREMFPYIKKESRITFLTRDRIPEELVSDFRNQELIRFEFREGITYDRDVLERIDFNGLDTIIIFANALEDGERSDSETLLTVLNLKEVEKERHADVSVIIEIEKNENETILQYASVDDFIISNVLSNKMLCQISENRHLNAVFEELLGEEGSEIYLKRADKYVVLHEEVDFYAVVESAIQKNELAIGYRKKSVTANGGIVINPRKDLPITFSEGDSIIVLAED